MSQVKVAFGDKADPEVRALFEGVVGGKGAYTRIDEYLKSKGLTFFADGGFEMAAGDSSIRVDSDGVTIGGGNPFAKSDTNGTFTVTDDTTPPTDTLADALNRIEEGYRELLSTLPAIREGLATIAELDGTAAFYGERFVNRLLMLTGSTERVGGPDTTPAPAQGPTAAELAQRRQRVIERTQRRLISARQTERATGDIADKLQACLEYAVRNTEPVDAYDLSNEERKTEEELKTLEREIDRYRDTEARAAERAETAERVLVEMAAWPRGV